MNRRFRTISRALRFPAMNLRTQTLLHLAVCGLVVIPIVYWISNQTVMDGFKRLEDDRANLNMQRVKAALDDKISALDMLTRDWASWDDTYLFILDHNDAYIRSNPTDSTLINAGLNLVVFVDRSNQIVYAKAMDLSEGAEVSLPVGVHELLDSGVLLPDYQGLSGKSGVVSSPEGVLIFAARPILTSDGKGPSHGALLMARYLDGDVMAGLSDSVYLPVTMSRISTDLEPSDFQQAASAMMSSHSSSFTNAVSANSIMGYTLVTDINENPVAVLRAEMPRDIYQQGKRSTAYAVLGLIGVAVAFVALVIWLVERLVLSKVARINQDVGEISASGDVKKRIRTEGGDEISRLGGSINGMLLSLERSEERLRESEATNRAMLGTINEKTRELEVAVRDADAANRAKSDFLASMSHELRTPLNAIIGFSQVLQEQYFGSLNDKQTEYVSDIVDSGQHLLSLINDILDLSKIESGKIELELSRVSVKELLHTSLVMIKEKAHAHGIDLETRVADDVGSLEVTGDERRLKQVMFNLLSNAAKFTPDGGTISVEVTRENGDLNISVSDTGIGLSAEEKKKLFQPFYQASGGLKNKTPGTGLGLSITKNIVEKHGGRIWVESEGLNKGSRFTFTLPLTQKASAPDEASIEAAR